MRELQRKKKQEGKKERAYCTVFRDECAKMHRVIAITAGGKKEKEEV